MTLSNWLPNGFIETRLAFAAGAAVGEIA